MAGPIALRDVILHHLLGPKPSSPMSEKEQQLAKSIYDSYYPLGGVLLTPATILSRKMQVEEAFRLCITQLTGQDPLTVAKFIQKATNPDINLHHIRAAIVASIPDMVGGGFNPDRLAENLTETADHVKEVIESLGEDAEYIVGYEVKDKTEPTSVKLEWHIWLYEIGLQE